MWQCKQILFHEYYGFSAPPSPTAPYPNIQNVEWNLCEKFSVSITQYSITYSTYFPNFESWVKPERHEEENQYRMITYYAIHKRRMIPLIYIRFDLFNIRIW